MPLILKWILFISRVILTFFRPVTDKLLDVGYFLGDILQWIFNDKPKKLPFIDNKILLMSATELAKKIRKKELSAVEVMQVYISRIKAVQPVLNACVDHRFEEAIADAKAVDRMLDANIKTEEEIAETMPLLGVPFTCKEIIGVKNLAQTWGLLRFKNRKAPQDSDVAALYRKAGAIPVVVTNIPTMCLWWDTSNNVFGATKNPYNRYRIPGGSSGGEAALISATGAVIGIGNDLGGSIRIPSSFCGIYGHKPSEGIISNKTTWPEMPNSSDAVENINKFVSTGPMCRYAEDLHLLVKVLSGNDHKKLRLHEKVDFSTVKVYYIEEFPGCLLSATSDVKAAVRKAVKHFETEYEITASKLNIKELKHSFSIWQYKFFEAAGAFQRQVMTDEEGNLNLGLEYLKCVLGISEYDYRLLYYASIEIQKKDKFYEKRLDMYKVIERDITNALDGNAILILPIHPEPPPHSIVTIPKFENIAYTCIFNILGLPGTSVPAGQSKGLPIGLQVMAKKNNDRLTLAAAVELNKVFGGWRNPCPILA